MSLTGRAVLYLQKTFPGASFIKDIIIQDDGQGPYIKHWRLPSPQPSETELNQAGDLMMDPPAAMPSDHALLMMLYNDKKDNTNTFVTAIDTARGL